MYYRDMSTKNKILIYISVIILAISVGLQTKDLFIKDNYEINYEYINIKDMATVKVATKTSNKSNNTISKLLFSTKTDLGEVEAVDMTSPEAVELPVQNSSSATISSRKIWYLPTEIGQVTQYPSYGHVAYDITSPRGTGETIHPVANGVISGIYTDYAGALIVTVLHQVNGIKYTSQYVHLSRYADGIYVGKEVTINDALGQMGTTGNSTGVHLHIAVLDCALFDSTDSNCPNLGAWYRYDKIKFSQNFHGLGELVDVPYSWNSR